MPTDDHELAQKMFGDTLNRENRLIDEVDLSLAPEAADAGNEQWRHALNDLELGDTEGAQVTRIVKQAIRERPSDAQVREWREQAQDELRREFGDASADEWGSARHRLSLAQKLVAKNPAYGRLLDDLNLADHPALVRMAIDKAWSLRGRGRL